MQVGTSAVRQPRQPMDCRYFGDDDRRLFGILDRPPGAPPGGCVVVLCHPFGREFLRSHRAYRQLALRLASAGFPVLRFDYYGCGDSAGDSTEGTIEGWLDDICQAAREARNWTGCREICLAGLRLGASLAAEAAARMGDIDHLALWDPIDSGSRYLEELVGLHQAMMGYPDRKTLSQILAEGEGLLGFPLSEALRQGLEGLDLGQLPVKPARNVLVIENVVAENVAEDGLSDTPDRAVQRRQRLQVDCQRQVLPGPEVWKDDEQALVPMGIIQAIVGWLSEVTS